MVLSEFLDEWNDRSATLLVHTSGSTGKPKPIRVEKKRMEESARITCSFLGLQPDDTALLCLPLDYIAGKMMVVRALTCGLKLIEVPPAGHPLACLVGKGRHIDFAAMVPMQVYNSLQVPEERKLLLTIRHLIIGGGAIDDAMEQQLRTFPNAVWSTYGMTETLSHIALRRLSGAEASLWYTPFESVRVGLNKDNCLVIDAPRVCNAVLTTNDVAEMAEDGRHFRIIGRKDNVIDSGGIKIQAEEVERLLRPYMPEPYLITKRHDGEFGEAVVLLVQSVGVERVREVCRRVLPKYWQPRCILSVSAIPMTQTGKPDRARAERMASRGEE
jgi:O-succinylbenzoic acid--coA ligase family protein